MHGYCHCSSCKDEWYGRNAYWLSDDTPPRHRSQRRNTRHKCKKNKFGPHKYEAQPKHLRHTYTNTRGETVRQYEIVTECIYCHRRLWQRTTYFWERE